MECGWTIGSNRHLPNMKLARRVLPPRLPVIAALGLFCLAGSQPARAEDLGVRASGRLVDVRVLVDGSPTRLYARWQGDDRRYFEAIRGENYALELRNRTEQRVGVLIAVDGLNVITGARSTLGAHESMYVLGPRERTVIRGWRTSLDDIQQFIFVDEERSYAERSGQANADLGWIRVLTFAERAPLVRMRVGPTRDEGSAQRDEPPSAALDHAKTGQSAAPEADGRETSRRQTQQSEEGVLQRRDAESFPGTGWGAHRRDRVAYTSFDAEQIPADHLVFRYEYRAALRALGLMPHRHRLDERDAGEFGFAQPPRR